MSKEIKELDHMLRQYPKTIDNVIKNHPTIVKIWLGKVKLLDHNLKEWNDCGIIVKPINECLIYYSYNPYSNKYELKYTLYKFNIDWYTNEYDWYDLDKDYKQLTLF